MTAFLDKPVNCNRLSTVITQSDFDQFEKEFLFNRISGNKTFGAAFCEKFGITDFVLSIIKSEERAKKHIATFKYIK
jgi:hypothetical protein